MKLRFWGVRGSLPSPIRGYAVREKVRSILQYATPSDVLDPESIDRFLRSLPFSLTQTYGGNTTCVEVRSKNDNLIIIDAGSGLRELGNRLMQQEFAHGDGIADFLFTHTHWDHIQGIPFFTPLYIPDNQFRFHSVFSDLEERLRYQHPFSHFPVDFDQFMAHKSFHIHDEKSSWQLHGLNIKQMRVRHPGGCFSYSIEEDDKKVIFSSDSEFKLEEMDNIAEYLDYLNGADVLIFDTQYTFEEQLQKIDWGHSSAAVATDLALKAGVKRLVMFHHDPAYSDEKLDEVHMAAIRYKEMMDPHDQIPLEITMAYEGLELTL